MHNGTPLEPKKRNKNRSVSKVKFVATVDVIVSLRTRRAVGRVVVRATTNSTCVHRATKLANWRSGSALGS